MSAESIVGCARYLTGLLKLIKLHRGLENVVFAEQIPEFLTHLERVLEEERALNLEARESFLLANKRVVKGIGQGAAAEYFHALQELGLSAIWIGRPLTDEDVRRFLSIVLEKGGGDDSAATITEALSAWGLQAKLRVVAFGEGGGTADQKAVKIGDQEYFPLAYGRLLVLLREYARNTDDPELSRYFRQKLHRAAGELARLIPRYSRRVLALTTIRHPDDPLFNRLASVGLLALVLGQRLGLDRRQLADLSLCAYLQGVGQSFSEADANAPRERVVVRELARGRELSLKALATTVVGLAPPEPAPGAEVHPYAHVVAVCRTYLERVTDGGLRPDEAVKELLAQEDRFEPVLLKALANLLGVYPVGTCVRLTGGELGVVVHPNPGFPGRPLVSLVKDATGEDGEGRLVDLAEKDVRGEYRVAVKETLDPASEGIRVSDYLLG